MNAGESDSGTEARAILSPFNMWTNRKLGVKRPGSDMQLVMDALYREAISQRSVHVRKPV